MKHFIRFMIVALLSAASFSVFALDGEDCKFEALDLQDKIPVRAEGKIISLFPKDGEMVTDADIGSVFSFFITFTAATMEKRLSLKINDAQAMVRMIEKVPEFLDLVVPLGTPPERVLSLVRLTVRDQSRMVQVSRLSSSRFTGNAESERDFGENTQVPLFAEKVADQCLWRGGRWAHYKMKPAAPLEKGEYAFLIYRRMYDFGVD